MAAPHRNDTSALGWITDLICFVALGLGLALWVGGALRASDVQSPTIVTPDTQGGTGHGFNERPDYI